MNRTETLQVLAVLRGAYPAFYRGMDKQEAERVADLWASLFADDDAAMVGAAVKALIVSDDREFPPLVGTVKEKMRQLSEPEDMTEAEAWNLVARAAKNSLYGAADEFAKLPPSIQKLLGSPDQLREYAQMPSDTLHSVVASNFQRSYKVVLKRQREQAKLPGDVKRLVSALGSAMALEGHEDEI